MYYSRGFLTTNKWRLCSCLVISLIGLIVGVLAMLPSETLPTSCNYLILMQSGQYSIFGMFIKQTLLQLLLLFVICVGVFHPALRCLGWIILFIVGYRLGAIIVVSILENTMLGIVFGLILIIPMFIYNMLITATIICYVSCYLQSHGRYRRCSSACRGYVKDLLRKVGCCGGIMVICSVIFVLIIPSFVSIIIVV